MKHKIKTCLFLMPLIFLLPSKSPKANTLTPQAIAKKALSATVQITTIDANGNLIPIGSGFFVRRNYIATNFHVIEDLTASKLRIKLVDRNKIFHINPFIQCKMRNLKPSFFFKTWFL